MAAAFRNVGNEGQGLCLRPLRCLRLCGRTAGSLLRLMVQVVVALPVPHRAKVALVTVLCAAMACSAGTAGFAQPAQVNSAFLRQSQSASDRRNLIIALLVSRGVESPLLPRREAVSDALRQDAALPSDQPPQGAPGDAVTRLLSLIASAEAGADGYNAVNYRATVRPPKLPTELTIAEIFVWIDETPRQNHAIGRYQIIPMTLSYLIAAENISGDAVYTAELQDRLARRLLDEAGFQEFLSGQLSAGDFQDSLAFVWAGLPLRSGLSAYDGIAENKATITRKDYDDRFAQIFGRTDRIGLGAASGTGAIRTAGN